MVTNVLNAIRLLSPVLVLGVAACSNAAAPGPAGGSQPTTARPAAASTPTPSATPTAGGPLSVTGRQICAAKVPASLRTTIENGWQPPIADKTFTALAVNGTRVYGNGGRDSDIYVADTSAKTVTKIADLPAGAAGTAWMDANDVAVTWLNYEDPKDPGRWSLHVAAPDGSNPHKVAGSPKDQPDGQGRSTQQALLGNRLAWTEWDFAKKVSTLKVMDLTTGTVRSAGTGNFYPPVAMRDSFVWPEKSKGDGWTLRAVNATTLTPVKLPPDLPVMTGVGHLAATPDRLMWGSEDYRTLNVWDAARGRVDQYRVPEGDEHIFQFLKPTGTHVTWYTTWPYSMIDLTTAVVYDVGIDVNTTAGDGLIAVSYMKRTGEGRSATRGPVHLSIIKESDLPQPSGDCAT